MKKYVTLIMAAMIVGSTPVLAAAPDAETKALPKVLTDLGITHEDLNDVDAAFVDTPTFPEKEALRHRQRYCPRGYHLRAYRFRIGRFVIVRYRCERNRRRHWDYKAPASQQPAAEQTIQ